MRRTGIFLLAVTVFCGFTGCQESGKYNSESINKPSHNPVSVSGTRFVDSLGRQVIFNGINVVNKNPAAGYLDPDSIGTYRKLGQWGFNCIRLGVMWDGVEPEPGKYDDLYLERVAERIRWAGRNGMYVMLDMHQDLYGVKSGDGTPMGDGAPQWATLTENQPHVTGGKWSDSYLISPAVQKAFDNFWSNAPAPDHTGIQDHYALMWQHVAKYFASDKTVIGYDIMNEPFYGSRGVAILKQMLTSFGTVYAEKTGKILSENEIMAIWTDDEQRNKAISMLQGVKDYARVIDAGESMSIQFEKTSLQDMYQRVSNAIRKVDTTHIIFLEHAYFGNLGIRTGIEPVKTTGGNIDPLVAYAGHVYDILVDTKDYKSQSFARVALTMSRINEASERLDVPVIIGEWGAFYNNHTGMVSQARFVCGEIARYRFGNTYWSYFPAIDKNKYFTSAIVRPYPAYTAGILRSYNFDNENGNFKMSWSESENIEAPTCIYIPDIRQLDRKSISVIPENREVSVQPIEGCDAGYLIIPVTGRSVDRSVTFMLGVAD